MSVSPGGKGQNSTGSDAGSESQCSEQMREISGKDFNIHVINRKSTDRQGGYPTYEGSRHYKDQNTDDGPCIIL